MLFFVLISMCLFCHRSRQSKNITVVHRTALNGSYLMGAICSVVLVKWYLGRYVCMQSALFFVPVYCG